MLKVGVIGYGYWGPNIVRNFASHQDCQVVAICDKNPKAVARAVARHQGVKMASSAEEIVASSSIDAVAIVTPVSTHYELAKKALENGKHVFVEKPFTATSDQAKRLIDLAERNNLVIMVDHTFLFTGAVRKIKELVDGGVLGRLYYYDSTRVNLGLFQHDVNVIWDLAPHDLSIMDYVIGVEPEFVEATGGAHLNGLEDVAFLTLYFPGDVIAHINVNWLSPVKVRTTLLGGERKMLLWNDLEPAEKIKVYDKGVEVGTEQGVHQLLVSYRSGDMWAPRIEEVEALQCETRYFMECVAEKKTPLNDGRAGLRVVSMLEAAERSLKRGKEGVKRHAAVACAAGPPVVGHGQGLDGDSAMAREDVFRIAAIRERKHADRSGRSYVVIRVTIADGPDAEVRSTRAMVVEAMRTLKRETDVLGWLEWPRVVGLIVPDIQAPEAAKTAERLCSEIARTLAGRLDTEAAGRITIGHHVYPEPKQTGAGGPWPADQFFYPELVDRWVGGGVYDVIKRGLDVVGSLALLAGLLPVLIVIAMLVKATSRGPVLLRQVRVGRMAKPFTMLKFRTMDANADQTLHLDFVSRFINGGQAQELPKNGLWKLTNDPRVTPLGRMLRKTSLDELPQLVNVLRGEMSLVGPRPPLPYELEQYESWHRRRVLEAKPGITGLWQVAGRSRTTFEGMVRLDLRYARRRSLWLDLKILLVTPVAVLRGKGAC